MNGTTPRAVKKERKVTIAFRRTNEPQHEAGVESILLGNNGSLFTASRDSTIKRWDVSGGTPSCTASFDGHADWVNDLAIVNDLLFSCSNDKTVRVWQAQSSGALITTLSHHSDYVTSLAAAPARGLVATGGLRGEVFILDVATGQPVRLRPKLKADPSGQQKQQQVVSSGSRPGYGPLSGDNGRPPSSSAGSFGAEDAGVLAGSAAHKASIYSLAINQAGTVVAAGSSDHFIRLVDTRTGEKVSKLRGHTENVRALAINPGGDLLLSGSSDGTLKLWDLGMQRCVQTYVVHTDTVSSVVACAASGEADWSLAITGGRDGRVFRTHLSTRTAELLVQQAPPVSAMAYDTGCSRLWVASPHNGSVSCYQVPREASGAAAKGSGGPGSGAAFAAPSRVRPATASGSSGHFGRNSVDVLRAQTPAATAPVAVLPGLHPIVTHRVLTDRRHVLTRDSEGVVELWDVLAGARVSSYGKADIAAVEAALFAPRAVPAWFGADCKLGGLSITLEPPSCFAAEDYAQSLGYAGVPDDCKLNYGKMVLDAAFAKWRHRVGQGHMLHAGGMGADGEPPQGGPQAPHGSQSGSPGSGQRYYQDSWPKYWEGVQPAVISLSAAGLAWRRVIGGFSGAEVEPDEVPAWVGDVVLRGAVLVPKEAKCAFILLPEEGSNLPGLLQSKLNAPRILQVHKVASYAISKLEEANIHLEMWPVYMQRPEGAQDPQPAQGVTTYYLELTCNGMAVPYEMSLAAVKKYIWRKPDDVVFVFRVRDNAAPAQLPTITHTPSS
mmetsp:Transcript_29377/g.74897  ORF Transcript_29377/g.74897 Transcript_29377/m.74897 type:complete len:779 (-) Transcript_29377:258-2594(-)